MGKGHQALLLIANLISQSQAAGIVPATPRQSQQQEITTS